MSASLSRSFTSYARYLGYTEPETESSDAQKEKQDLSALEATATAAPPIEDGKSDQEKTDLRSSWLISRWFDLLFVCGGAPWIVAIIAFSIFGPLDVLQLDQNQFSQSDPFNQFNSKFNNVRQLLPFDPAAGPATDFTSQQVFSIIFVIAALLVGEAHQFTSIVRYFTGFGNKKNRYRWVRVPMWGLYLGIVAALLSLLGAPISDSFLLQIIGVIAAIGFFCFPTILMQHVAAQAKAVGMFYCGMGGYKLSKFDKALLSTSTWFLALAGGATIAGPFELLESINNQFTAWQALPIGLILAAQISVAMFAVKVIGRGIRKGEWLPPGASLLWINLALWTLLPTPELVFVWLSVPLLFHATQHWAVAWFTRRNELKAKGVELTGTRAIWQFVKMCVPIQAFTLFILFLPAIFANHSLEGTETLAVGWSMLVFYVHYFADRVVWRPQ